MRAAVTGGTGFLGAALIDKLLKEGWNITALARDPRRIAKADALCIVEGDLQNKSALRDLAAEADIFFHLAGVTHAHDDRAYHTVNVEGAGNAARAAVDVGAKLVHISSLSARMPDMSPYAMSKFESEGAVAREAGPSPWLALRLPALYGPGDLVTLPYFKLVKSGLALEPRTSAPARASLLFVADAAEAVIAATGAADGAVYEVGDDVPSGREWAEIGAVLGNVLGKDPRQIRVPRALISAYHGILRAAERRLGKPPSVRAGQVNEFFHPDWVARDNLLSDVSSWRAATPLKEGFAKTVHWYQEHGLL